MASHHITHRSPSVVAETRDASALHCCNTRHMHLSLTGRSRQRGLSEVLRDFAVHVKSAQDGREALQAGGR